MSNDPHDTHDARCHLCNTNIEDWQHLASAPCPATPEGDRMCAACCAASDSSCPDCLSVLVAHLPPRARHPHDNPTNQHAKGTATPRAGSRVVGKGTDAATATASHHLHRDAPTTAVAAPSPSSKATP